MRLTGTHQLIANIGFPERYKNCFSNSRFFLDIRFQFLLEYFDKTRHCASCKFCEQQQTPANSFLDPRLKRWGFKKQRRTNITHGLTCSPVKNSCVFDRWVVFEGMKAQLSLPKYPLSPFTGEKVKILAPYG